MKILTTGGVVSATAETIEDVKTLLALEKVSTKKTGRPRGTVNKKQCPKCEKKVKYIAYHDKVMHGEGRLLGATRGEVAHRVNIIKK